MMRREPVDRDRNCLRRAGMALLVLCFALSGGLGCGRLDSLTSGTTPSEWLASHPWIRVDSGPLHFTLAEPSSTVFVYGLGVVLAMAGISFLRRRPDDERPSASRLAWGIALLVWSVATFSAGTSYQAFAYEIKYAGRPAGLWTSWWEIAYLALFVLNLASWLRTRRRLELRLVLCWLGLLAVTAAYFGYYLSGAAEALWSRGIWFNANDVLHLGLVAWVLWLMRGVRPLAGATD